MRSLALRSWVLSLLVAAMTISMPSGAHAPGIVLSGVGTATIDGIISPGEWDNAAIVNFDLVTFGQVHPSTLLVMNDDTFLFLAVVIRNEDFKESVGVQGDILRIFFDNDHDGGIAFSESELGDDFMEAPIPFVGLTDSDEGQ